MLMIVMTMIGNKDNNEETSYTSNELAKLRKMVHPP